MVQSDIFLFFFRALRKRFDCSDFSWK